MLERHEGRADRHDHLLDVGEELVRNRLAVAVDRDLDPDLVDRMRLEAGLPQLCEQPVAVRDSGGLDLEVLVRHGCIIPLSSRS